MSAPREDTPRLTPAAYARDRLGSICAWVLAACGAALVCRVQGATGQGAAACALLVLTVGAAALLGGYLRRRPYYRAVEEAHASLEQAYHLASLVDEPAFLEGRLAYATCCEVCEASGAQLGRERERMEALQRFVDLWTHEIKTPIASAKLTLSRMRGEDAERLRLDLERIEASCERALYTTRVGLVSGDYALEPVCLDSLCKEACKSLSHLLVASGVAPRFELGAGDRVLADSQWVTFVLRQLISNSAKYGAHTLRFRSRVERPGTPQGCVVLEVADDGIGIPADEVPCVFERGFCGSNGRAQGSATGMGLFLSAQLCEAMGVGLTVGSTLGEGTRVALSFPLDASRL